MEHSFDIDIAQEYGIGCAIILKHLYFWIRKNQACERNFHDGKYWTYGSTKAFNELFPYMGEKQIRNVLKRMEENNLIEVGNYNDLPFDRTKWYCLTEKGYALIQKANSTSPKGNCHSAKGQMTFGERADDIRRKGEPIPDIYTDINTNIYTDIEKKNTKEKKSVSLGSIIAEYTQNAELIEALNAFVDTRKDLKKPLNEHSLKLALSKLDKLAIDDYSKEEIVNQSVEHGWMTFYEIKKDEKQKGNDSNNWSFMDY